MKKKQINKKRKRNYTLFFIISVFSSILAIVILSYKLSRQSKPHVLAVYTTTVCSSSANKQCYYTDNCSAYPNGTLCEHLVSCSGTQSSNNVYICTSGKWVYDHWVQNGTCNFCAAPTPTHTPTPTPTPTPTHTPTPTPMSSPAATSAPTTTSIPTQTPLSSPTLSPTPTLTDTPFPTSFSDTPVPTITQNQTDNPLQNTLQFFQNVLNPLQINLQPTLPAQNPTPIPSTSNQQNPTATQENQTNADKNNLLLQEAQYKPTNAEYNFAKSGVSQLKNSTLSVFSVILTINDFIRNFFKDLLQNTIGKANGR